MVNGRVAPSKHPRTKDPQSDRLICQSIVTGHLVVLRYDGGLRVIEPTIHGHTAAGIELLCGFQRHGSSTSGASTGWKTFRVARIEDLEVLDVVILDAWRPIRHWPPRGIATLHCSA